MGTLRLLLAITVVLTHSYGFVFVGGQNAVRLFYMISGFLISHVLITSKSYSSVTNFYINRYLRLYPVYFYVAMMSLVYYLIAYLTNMNEGVLETFLQVPAPAKIISLLANASLFFQDWLMFVGIDSGSIVLQTSNENGVLVLSQTMLVSQAWTLGFELAFYLLAPFVLPRTTWLISLLGLSLLVRFILNRSGFGQHSPWNYYFFPAELSFFLFGALAQQYLLPCYRKLIAVRLMPVCARTTTFILLLVVACYWLVPLRESVKSVLLFMLFLLLLPFPFIFQSGNVLDNRLGDLSYPLYICHGLVIKLATFWLATIDALEPLILAAVSLTTSFMFAIALDVRVGKPVEQLRNRFRTPARV